MIKAARHFRLAAFFVWEAVAPAKKMRKQPQALPSFLKRADDRAGDDLQNTAILRLVKLLATGF